MATVHRGFSQDDVRDIMYKRPSRLLDRYHEERFSDDGIGSSRSSRFRERVREKVDRLKRTRLYRASTATYRKLRNRGREDRIEPLLDIDRLQHAGGLMQEAIMASPRVRRRWLENRMAGYENGYNETTRSRSAFKHTHDTYRNIMDGIVHEDNDDVVAHTYVRAENDHNPFSRADVLDIRQTWQRVDELMWENLDDPTSEYNAML